MSVSSSLSTERTRIHGGPTMGKVYQDTDGRKVIFSLQDLTFWVVGKPDRIKFLKKEKKRQICLCCAHLATGPHIEGRFSIKEGLEAS